MGEGVVETILLRAHEKFPLERPRIISDNGPPFIAKDFKEFIRIMGTTHVRTSPYYPQSNGKIERFHKSYKTECVREKVPLSLEDAQRITTGYVTHYNESRLHSAIGYVTPKDKLLGNDEALFAARDRKLADARERRKQMRQTQHEQIEAASDPARPVIDFATVRAAITIAQVLALLGFVPRSDHAGQQRGACPLHGSTHGTARCFSVNTNAHTFHCFKCGRSGNALELWAAAQGLSLYDAAIDLCQRLNTPLPILAPPATANREEETVATGSTTCTIP